MVTCAVVGEDNDMRMLEDIRAELVAAGYMRASAAQALIDAKRSGGNNKKTKGNATKEKESKRGAAARAAAEVRLISWQLSGISAINHSLSSVSDRWRG